MAEKGNRNNRVLMVLFIGVLMGALDIAIVRFIGRSHPLYHVERIGGERALCGAGGGRPCLPAPVSF